MALHTGYAIALHIVFDNSILVVIEPRLYTILFTFRLQVQSAFPDYFLLRNIVLGAPNA
jgi:hypothetical protein